MKSLFCLFEKQDITMKISCYFLAISWRNHRINSLLIKGLAKLLIGKDTLKHQYKQSCRPAVTMKAVSYGVQTRTSTSLQFSFPLQISPAVSPETCELVSFSTFGLHFQKSKCVLNGILKWHKVCVDKILLPVFMPFNSPSYTVAALALTGWM